MYKCDYCGKMLCVVVQLRGSLLLKDTGGTEGSLHVGMQFGNLTLALI